MGPNFSKTTKTRVRWAHHHHSYKSKSTTNLTHEKSLFSSDELCVKTEHVPCDVGVLIANFHKILFYRKCVKSDIWRNVI